MDPVHFDVLLTMTITYDDPMSFNPFFRCQVTADTLYNGDKYF